MNVSNDKLGRYRDMLCFAWRNWRIHLNNARLDMAASNRPFFHQVPGRTFVVGGGVHGQSYTKSMVVALL